MAVKWDSSAARQAMDRRPMFERTQIANAIDNGVNVSNYRASLHPPGSSKRSKVWRRA